MPSRYIKRMVNLEQRDYQLVSRLADEKGFGRKGFSAAVRFILREWEALTGFSHKPDPHETPDQGAPSTHASDSLRRFDGEDCRRHSPDRQHSDPNAPNFQHPPFP